MHEDPERKCIVTGESQPKAGLIRFCLSPEGMMVPDVLSRLPGRGIYVTASREALDKAIAKGLFARAAKQPVTLAPDMLALIEAQLARRVTDYISMARKAGEAVCGFEKVKDWLNKDRAAILIQASDGSERGKEKLFPPEGEGSLIGCLTSGELGLAFGRERAIHAALAAGRLTTRVVEEAARLSGVRGMTVKRVGRRSAGKDTKDA
jgi:uncharacterized protein